MLRHLGPGALVLVVFLCSCSTARVADFKDSITLSVTAGMGLSIDASLGALSQPALGIGSANTGFGILGRDLDGFYLERRINTPYAFGKLRERGIGAGAALNSSGWRATYKVSALQRGFEELAKPLTLDRPREFGREIAGRTYGGQVVIGRWLPILDDSAALLDPVPAPESPFAFGRLTDLELGAQLVVFGGRIGFNPLEFVDFLLGFGGIDIAGDDVESAPDGEPDGAQEESSSSVGR